MDGVGRTRKYVYWSFPFFQVGGKRSGGGGGEAQEFCLGVVSFLFFSFCFITTEAGQAKQKKKVAEHLTLNEKIICGAAQHFFVVRSGGYGPASFSLSPRSFQRRHKTFVGYIFTALPWRQEL